MSPKSLTPRIIGFVVAAFELVGIASAQNPPVFPGQLTPVGNNPVAVAAADLDGDGMTDLVTANHDGNSISILLGNGAGAFTALQDTEMAPAPQCIIVVDLNGDGHLDVIVGNGGPVGAPGLVTVRLNTSGAGAPFALGPMMSFPCGSDPRAIAAADMNGDGKLDVIVGNAGSNDVAILFGDGSGHLAPPLSLQAGGPVMALAVQDFTGDGHADIAAGTANPPDPIKLWKWSAAAGFLPVPGPMPPPGFFPTFLALADLNGDGKLDLLAGCPGPAPGGVGTTVFSFGNNGAGVFDSFFMPTAVEDSMTGLALFDLNGDGRPDLITSHDSTGSMSTRFGIGAGVFGPVSSYLFGNGSLGAKALAVAKLNNVPIVGTGLSVMSFGGFACSPVLTANNTYQICIYNNYINDGKFSVPQVISNGLHLYYCVAIGDVNSDGIPDVAATAYPAGTLDSFEGLGDGTLATTPIATSSLADTPECFALGDMNGDGVLDAVCGGLSHFQVGFGSGSGTFGPFTTYDSPGGPYGALALGDIDLDGHLDVVYSSSGTFNVYYRLGLGNGQLGSANATLASSVPYLAIGNINFDAFPDLVASSSDGNVYYAQGKKLLGSYLGFISPVSILSATDGEPVLLADISGDHNADVVACVSNTVKGMLGDGTGGFGTPISHTMLHSPTGIASSDFDRDGYNDVVTASLKDSMISLRFSSKNGLTNAWGSYSVDAFSISAQPFLRCAVGDLNGDGAPDIVTAGGKLDVFLNQIPLAPFTVWYGWKNSTKGCAGLQALDAVGDAKVGNASFQIHCGNAPVNSLGLGIVTTAAIPNGADSFGIGLNLLVDLISGSPITFDLSSDANGEGFGPISIPNQPYLVGFTGYAQALWYWPSACNPSQLNLSSSGGVALYIHE